MVWLLKRLMPIRTIEIHVAEKCGVSYRTICGRRVLEKPYTDFAIDADDITITEMLDADYRIDVVIKE